MFNFNCETTFASYIDYVGPHTITTSGPKSSSVVLTVPAGSVSNTAQEDDNK